MGTGYRVFLVDQDDQLHRISQKRFKDFFDRRELVLDPFIGQDKVRYANVVYETDRRKPSAIIHEEYFVLPLGADGMLDRVRLDEGRLLLWQSRSPLEGLEPVVRKDTSVVDGTRIFAEKRARHECEWQPSLELQTRIREAILG
ncbi:MAG: hypothetical protein GY722_01955 [bacterium]|nr:hypothetical protein [bacterium]